MPAQGAGASRDVLSSFAKAHNVNLGDALGSGQKRPSPTNSPADGVVAKRACAEASNELPPLPAHALSSQERVGLQMRQVRPLRPSQEALPGDSAANISAGLSAARQQGPAAPASKLSELAAQLGPYVGGATQCETQAMTQLLSLPSGSEKALNAEPALPVRAGTGAGKKAAGSVRKGRGSSSKKVRSVPHCSMLHQQ